MSMFTSLKAQAKQLKQHTLTVYSLLVIHARPFLFAL